MQESHNFSRESVNDVGFRHMLTEREVIKKMSKFVYRSVNWTPNDAVLIETGGNKFIVCQIDTLVKKTDVPPAMSLRQAGRKAAVAVVSDLASKGVATKALVYSISLPISYSLKDIEKIALGLRDASIEYSFRILGADTNEADDLVITCCAIGTSDKEIPTRSKAKPGDIVVSTGFFGLQPLGLKILLSQRKPKDEVEKRAVNTVLYPKAKLREGILTISTGAVTASMDSSDGLSCTLNDISENSSVKIIIENLPISPGLKEKASELGLSAEDLTLNGGEEYEIIFTLDPKRAEKAFELARKNNFRLLRIGRVEEGRGVFISKKGRLIKVKRGGWEHFKR